MPGALKVIVTGAGGFLGGAIVRALRDRGDEVLTIQRGTYPELARLGVVSRQGDLADPATLSNSISGYDVVFHVAAKAGVWGSYNDYHRANVQATENVIAACQRDGVRKLVYTSSPSVVFDGRNENGINERVPYPKRYLAHYPKTKAEAEKQILTANSPNLATVVLRPHLIWGPGDPHLVPRILSRAREGKLRLVGSGENLVDSTYIDNAVDAHLLAADRLGVDGPVSGQVYFISNGEPLPMAELLAGILAAGHEPPVTRHMPVNFAFVMGAGLELAYRLLRIDSEPVMTRFVARQLATSHWFDLSAARSDLGYEPQVSIAEGLRRLAQSLNPPHRLGN